LLKRFSLYLRPATPRFYLPTNLTSPSFVSQVALLCLESHHICVHTTDNWHTKQPLKYALYKQMHFPNRTGRQIAIRIFPNPPAPLPFLLTINSYGTVRLCQQECVVYLCWCRTVSEVRTANLVNLFYSVFFITSTAADATFRNTVACCRVRICKTVLDAGRNMTKAGSSQSSLSR